MLTDVPQNMQTPAAQGNPLYPNMNPLATQFMTGGQMGYMPDAQFLTSSQYGAFRTTPSFAQHSNFVQNPTLWQSYTQAHMGAFPGISGSEFMLSSYIPQANQLKMRVMAQRRLADVGSAVGGTGADFAGSLLGGVAGEAVGGPIGGLIGGLIAPSVAAPYLDRIRNSRDLQQRSMSKIAVGPDVSKSLGQGFSLKASSSIEENVIKSAVSDKLFKEEDFRKLQKLGMESGLYDFDSSAEDYKRTLKKLTKNFKFMMGMLETADMGEVAKDMKRLQRMGMSADLATSVSSAENTYGRMTGLNHQQMVNTYGKQGALTFSQYGLSGYQGSLENMAAAARVETMKRLGIVNESTVSRHGGVSGMAQTDTQNTAAGMNAISDYLLPALVKRDKNGKLDFGNLDANSVAGAISGKSNIFANLRKTAVRMRNSGIEGVMEYTGQKPELLKQLFDQAGPAGMQILMANLAEQMGKEANIKGRVNQMTFGYGRLSPNMSPEDARNKAKQMNNPEYLEAIKKQLQQGQNTRKMQEYTLRRQERSIAKRAGTAYNKFMYKHFGSIYARYTDNAAIDKDIEENELNGILDSSQRGMGFGTKGFTEVELQKLREEVPGAAIKGDDYYRMTSPSGHDRKNSASMFRNADELIASKDMSSKDRIAELAKTSKMAKDAGLSVSPKDLQQLSSKLGDTSTLSDSNIKKELTSIIHKNNPKASSSKVKKVTDKILDSSESRAAIFNMAANSDEEQFSNISSFMNQAHQSTAMKSVSTLDKSAKDIRDDMGEMVEQLGLFNIDNTEDLNTLSKATKVSAKSIYSFNAFAALSSLKNSSGGEAGFGVTTDNSKKLGKLRKSLEAMGMSKDEVTAIMKSAEDDPTMGKAKKLIQAFTDKNGSKGKHSAKAANKIVDSLSKSEMMRDITDTNGSSRLRSLRKSLTAMGMPKKKIEEVIQATKDDPTMDTASKMVQEYQEANLGLSSKESEAVQGAGYRSGASKNAAEIRNLGTVGKGVVRDLFKNAQKGKNYNIYKAFKGDFSSHNMDATKALLDPKKVGSLIQELKDEDDPKNKEKIAHYTELKKGLEDGTVKTVGDAGKVFGVHASAVIKRNITDSMTDPAGADKAKTEGAVVDSIEYMVDKLDGPLRLVSVGLHEVAEATIATKVAMQQRQIRNGAH